MIYKNPPGKADLFLRSSYFFTLDIRMSQEQRITSMPVFSSSSKKWFMPMESDDMCPAITALICAFSALSLCFSDMCIPTTVPTSAVANRS